jgi:hypothetical protein
MTLGASGNHVQSDVSGELLPNGSFVKVRMTLRPGGIDGSAEIDKGLLKASKAPGSNVLSLDCEFTVTDGPFANRKFRHLFTVAGGKVDHKGASVGGTISKRIFRSMIDSAFGLDPEDASEAATSKRQLRGLADLNGITFVAKVAVEPSKDPRYPDQNRLDHPVLPTDKEWRAVMNGENVAPRPSKPPSAGNRHSAESSAPTPQPRTSPAALPAQSAKPAGPAWLNG